MKKASLATMFALLLVVAIGSAQAQQDDGWKSLFGGQTLGGWKPNEHPESWTVQDGAIVGHGPRSHLYYMPEQFQNFELKADVMIGKGSNSGIYFHIKFHERGWFFDGHEVQINNTHTDPVKTGSLWAVVKLYESNAKDDEWFPMHIVVKGRNIVVQVNGKTVVDYTEPEGALGPRELASGASRHPRQTTGYIALQQHDPSSTVRFRNLMIKRLPPSQKADQ